MTGYDRKDKQKKFPSDSACNNKIGKRSPFQHKCNNFKIIENTDRRQKAKVQFNNQGRNFGLSKCLVQ